MNWICRAEIPLHSPDRYQATSHRPSAFFVKSVKGLVRKSSKRQKYQLRRSTTHFADEKLHWFKKKCSEEITERSRSISQSFGPLQNLKKIREDVCYLRSEVFVYILTLEPETLTLHSSGLLSCIRPIAFYRR